MKHLQLLLRLSTFVAVIGFAAWQINSVAQAISVGDVNFNSGTGVKSTVPSTGTINSSTTTVTTSTTTQADQTNVRFNEFYGDSASGWVELFNSGATAVDVTNWVIISSAGDTQILSGTILPAGYMSVTGVTPDSQVTLQTNTGQVIDTETYTAVESAESWSQYATGTFACDATPTKIAANAQVLCTTETTEEATENQNENVNTNTTSENTNVADTTETAETSSDGGVNATSSLYTLDRAWEKFRLAITVDDEKEAELSLAYAEERVEETKTIIEDDTQNQVQDQNVNQGTTDEKPAVRLSEVVHDEYIELYNLGTTAVTLTGYVIEVKDVNGVYTYTLPTMTIAAGKYISITAPVSLLKVDKAGGVITVLDPSTNVVDKTAVPVAVYPNAWAFDQTNKIWDCTSTTTYEAINVITDCPTTIDQPGVTGTEETIEETTTTPGVTETNTNTNDTDDSSKDTKSTDDKIALSEIEHTAFIELYNVEQVEVDLSGYVLEWKGDSGDVQYVIPTGTLLAANAYRAFTVATLGVPLDKVGGMVRLFDLNKNIVSQIGVPPYIDGTAFAYDLTKSLWDCTTTVTGDAVNVMTACEVATDTSTNTNQDSDSDGLTDDQEVNELYTDPTTNDTDKDGVSDNVEVKVEQTDPNNPDSDDDGVTDGTEIQTDNTDPNNAEEVNEPIDTDQDGLTDTVEEDLGTDPATIDTDGDGIEDPNDPEPTVAPEEAGQELSEEAAIAVEETMQDLEELIENAAEQEVSEEAVIENAQTMETLQDEIEVIAEEISGDANQTLTDTNETIEEFQEEVVNTLPEAQAEEVKTELEIADPSTDTEQDNTVPVTDDDTGNENVNTEVANENTNAENANTEVETNTNEANNVNTTTTTTTSDETVPAEEEIDQQRLEEELMNALDEINRLRDENQELQDKIKELEDKLFSATGEEVSSADESTTNVNESITGNENYTVIERESQLPNFSNVVAHVYFNELRAQPGDFTSEPGEHAFHNLDKVMYRLQLPDGFTSQPIYPGEVLVLDLEAGEYSYSAVNHPNFGPYKITVE